MPDPVVSLSELECKPIIIGLIVGSGSLRLVKSSGGCGWEGPVAVGTACKYIHRFTNSRSPVDRGKGIKFHLG